MNSDDGGPQIAPPLSLSYPPFMHASSSCIMHHPCMWVASDFTGYFLSFDLSRHMGPTQNLIPIPFLPNHCPPFFLPFYPPPIFFLFPFFTHFSNPNHQKGRPKIERACPDGPPFVKIWPTIVSCWALKRSHFLEGEVHPPSLHQRASNLTTR